MSATAKRRHFLLGIGGIGMSAIARHLNQLGHEVAGYDLTPSPLTEQLQREGMQIIHQDDASLLPAWCQHATPDDLNVVWTPAVPRSLNLVQHFERLGHRLVKRAEILGTITANHPTLAVAGTHGKTTTTGMLASMFRQTSEGCHAFLGGIDGDLGTNYITNPQAQWHVVEADEFDRSFHHLHPTHAAITSLDPDHLDVYESEHAFREAFEQFGRQVAQTLVLPHGLEWPAHKRLETFEVIEEGQTSSATHVATRHPESVHLQFSGQPGFHVVPQLPGKHNLANALVAGALAHHAGLTDDEIAQGIQSFGGVHRRFDVHLDTPSIVYIDDYAHHPTELKALLEAVRSKWSGRHVTLIFQPHLYSRTRDFGQEFAEVLATADQLFLLPIYPARELPIPGVDAQWLFENISSTHKNLASSETIFDSLKACPVDVVVTAGAGDIDRLVPKVLQHLQSLEK